MRIRRKIEPDPARPFPLSEAWRYDSEARLPVPAGAHLYDGCVHLNDIGCGYSSFLVVTGPQRGTVWVDYSAGDGDIAPVASFVDWYEAWLDEWAVAILRDELQQALDDRQPSEHDEYVRRWSICFERRAATGAPMARATKMPDITANAHPAVVASQPAFWAFERLRSTPATTPSPSSTRIIVPRNSPSTWRPRKWRSTSPPSPRTPRVPPSL